MSSKIPGLDHLRALAIILVFLFHYRLFPNPAWVDAIGSFGWTGVDLFFVLSGYLIAGQIFKGLKTGSFTLRDFFLKRCFRILPAFWTVVALYMLVPSFREWESLPPLWKLLTFTQNFGLDLRKHRTFSHAWSLCIEEQFYLLLPFTLLALRYLKAGRKSAILIILLMAAGFISRIASWKYFIAPAIGTDSFGALWYKWIYYPTYNRLDGLLAGIGLAIIVQYTTVLKSFITRHSVFSLFAGLAIAIAGYFICEIPTSYGASVFGFPVMALAYGLIAAAAVDKNSILNRFRSRVTSTIATLSYSIYLTHKASIHLAHEFAAYLGLSEEGTTAFFLSVLISFAIALILRWSIELPFPKWKEQILLKRAAEPLPAPAAGKELAGNSSV